LLFELDVFFISFDSCFLLFELNVFFISFDFCLSETEEFLVFGIFDNDFFTFCLFFGSGVLDTNETVFRDFLSSLFSSLAICLYIASL
jgi:hypothetical protein